MSIGKSEAVALPVAVGQVKLIMLSRIDVEQCKRSLLGLSKKSNIATASTSISHYLDRSGFELSPMPPRM